MNTELQQMDNEIKGQTLLKVFTARLAAPTLPLTKVCENLNLPYNTIRKWIAAGGLATYLAQIHDVRSDMSQAIALNELPSVVQHQAAVARGEKRGNATAAAEFVLQVAQLGARTERKVSHAIQVNQYMPGKKKEPGAKASPALFIDI